MKTLHHLPYVFAKKQGVIAVDIENQGGVRLYHLANTPLDIFAEVQRNRIHLRQVLVILLFLTRFFKRM